jgi:hypothetical protein
MTAEAPSVTIQTKEGDGTVVFDFATLIRIQNQTSENMLPLVERVLGRKIDAEPGAEHTNAEVLRAYNIHLAQQILCGALNISSTDCAKLFHLNQILPAYTAIASGLVAAFSVMMGGEAQVTEQAKAAGDGADPTAAAAPGGGLTAEAHSTDAPSSRADLD